MWTSATIGSPGFAPSSVMIGTSVSPNLSNASLRLPHVEHLNAAVLTGEGAVEGAPRGRAGAGLRQAVDRLVVAFLGTSQA